MRCVDTFVRQHTPPREEADRRFRELYELNYSYVLAYALRRAAPDVAHDVVAETFLVAWRRLDVMPRDSLPWLFGVARKVLANYRRSARRQQSLLTTLEAYELVRSRIEVDGGRAELGALAEAIDRLGEADQELLKLVYWEGLSSKAAASVLGLTPIACRVRLSRTRHRLSAALATGTAVRTSGPTGHLPQIREEASK